MKCKKCDPNSTVGANKLREDILYCEECGKQINSQTGYPFGTKENDKNKENNECGKNKV